MTDDELAALIGMRPDESQDDAIRRYVRETTYTHRRYVQEAMESRQWLLDRLSTAEYELKRMRKFLKKAVR